MKKTMIAPIAIVLVVLAYLSFIACLIFVKPGFTHATFTVVAVLVLTAVAAALIAVLVQRIREIKKGEEDDLGEY